MNQVEPSELSEPSQRTEKKTGENLSGLFVWIAAGAILFGSLPYLYPAGST